MCLAGVVLTAGLASARTVWNPIDPNIIAAGYGDWSDPLNWNAGVPVMLPEATNTAGKVVFYGLNKPECRVTTTTAECYYFVLGDNEPLNYPLRIMPGATLRTAANWCAVGYNATGAHLIVENGATLTCGSHLYVGMVTAGTGGGAGTLDINGGTVTVADAFELGRQANCLGTANLNDGVLQVRYLLDDHFGPGSIMNIKYGTLKVMNGDLTRVNAHVTGNEIVAFGGEGTLNVVKKPDNIVYVTANHPMNPSPAYRSTLAVPLGGIAPVDLSWTNVDPNLAGDPVYVDVWFGTDPNKLNTLAYSQVVAAGENATTVQVNAPVIGTAPTTYYWQVDSYIYGTPSGTPIESDVFKFDVTDDFPPTVIIETPDTVTWPNQPVQLNATVTDTGSSALSIEWSSNPAGAVFSPSANVEDPVVTVATAAGPVTLTCTVWDAFNPNHNTDSMILNVAADACAATGLAGITAGYPMDIAEPFCIVNIADLAALGLDWLVDYTLTEPTVIP